MNAKWLIGLSALAIFVVAYKLRGGATPPPGSVAKWAVGDNLRFYVYEYPQEIHVEYVKLDGTAKQWSYKLKDIDTGTIWSEYYLESDVVAWGAIKY